MMHRILWLSLAVTALLAVVLDVHVASAEESHSASEWLRQANAALTSYDYAGALEKFDHAVAQDPSAYLTYFRRSTAQQALGRTAAAVADLEATIERNPSFAKAYLQEARIHLKEGEYDDALAVLKRMAKNAPKDAAQEKELRTQVQHARDLSTRLAKLAKQPAQASECVARASELIKMAPNDVAARSHRAACHLAQGELEEAVTDWNRVAILAPSPQLQRRLSLLSFYVLGTHDSQMQKAGLNHLKACLHNDPDNKACSRAHKQLRKVDKALAKAHKFADAGSWTAVVSALKGPKVGAPTIYEEVENVLKAAQEPDADGEPLLPRAVEHPLERSELLFDIDTLYCRAYVGQNVYKKAMPFCDKLLRRDPNSVPALVAKGEDHLANGRYEEAVQTLSQAFTHSGQRDRDIHQRLTKAQKLLKQSKSKDYYKILGVARDADERTIKKAYRRLAREHHPDKGGSQEKMAEINEAFGVLGDPELRARFDQGDDPNDPMGGQQAYEGFTQGDVFQQMFQNAAFQQFARQHGGNAFQGGGAQFHFSF
ncbi:hypothetical protein MOBT1_003377 [Malassezia obtusa]|uniref:J domain-containing protein n=1 Tax=Malassezia obtusa TaxID=76774 RepID=A0AAF0E7Z1_9BASI|nr:hypothetical protein MOBT1_003377 [Malassezia obtusa]